MSSAHVLSGAAATTAMAKLRRRQSNIDYWPYPWIFPPKDSKKVMPQATIVAPAPTVQTTVLDYLVPTGMYFVMVGIVELMQPPAAGFVPGSGDVFWDVLLNPGAQNLPVEGLNRIPFPLGSFAAGMWWRLPAPEIFVSEDTIRSQITTTVDINPGAPNYFTSMFLGYLVPATGEQ